MNDRSLEQTCLMVLVMSSLTMVAEDWVVAIPFATLLAAGVIYRTLLTHWLFWTGIVGLSGGYLLTKGFSGGNGYFLGFYICLAVLVATFTVTPADVFRRNARFIIAFTFLFASFWKLASPDFISGGFMEFFLLKDDRVGPVAIVLTPLTYLDVGENRERMKELPEKKVVLTSVPEIKWLAVALSWLTLLIETLTAIVFLLPGRFAESVRDIVLITFLLTAYLFIPVPAFGMAYSCLGCAQTKLIRAKRIYQILYVLMPLTAARYYLFSWH